MTQSHRSQPRLSDGAGLNFSLDGKHSPSVYRRQVSWTHDSQPASSDRKTSVKAEANELIVDPKHAIEPRAHWCHKAASKYRASGSVSAGVSDGNDDHSSVALYFRDASRHSLLSQNEEIGLAKRIKDNVARITRVLGRFPAATRLLLTACRQTDSKLLCPMGIVAGLLDPPTGLTSDTDLIKAHLAKLSDLHDSLLAFSSRLDSDNELCSRQRID